MKQDSRTPVGPRILFLCTGNSCRSQMAEGIFKALDPSLQVFSAGTHPAAALHPLAVLVMREIGIDIGGQRPKKVDMFLSLPFDFVVTLCDEAKETCPVFSGRVENRIHIGFEDPAGAQGDEKNVLETFRRVRDEIRRRLTDFYHERVQL